MVVSCASFNCANRGQKKENVTPENHIHFHRFPLNDKHRLKKWLIAMRRENFVPNKYSYLCSEHFTRNDYKISTGNKSVKLNDSSVPSMFKFPAHLSRSPKKKRITQNSKRLTTTVIPTHTTHLQNTEVTDVTHLENTELTDQEQHILIRTSTTNSTINTPTMHTEYTDNITLDHVSNNTPTSTNTSSVNQVTRLRATGSRFEHVPRTKTPTKSILRRKIKILQQKLKRRNDRVNTLSGLLHTLRRKNLANDSLSMVLTQNFNEDVVDLLKEQAKNLKKPSKGRRYNSEVAKNFALTLNFYSPKAYNYVRKIFSSLPHPSTLRRWVSTTDCDPGFLSEVLEYLKVNISNSPNFPKYFSLVFDSMSIRKESCVDKKNMKTLGYVNYGNFTDQNETFASEALVFMLVSLTEKFKCPIGYFLTDKISGDIQAQLLKTAIEKVQDVGGHVVNVTFDGAQCNLSALNKLGCTLNQEGLKTKFKVNEEEIHVLLDPPHMVKLARNCLCDKKVICSPKGNIQWNLLEKLVEVQGKLGLKFANKLSGKHIKFQNKKMNVALAVQTLSSSVADALEYLMKSGHSDFGEAAPTVEFIRIIDRIFDLLNSRNPYLRGFKQAIRPSNLDQQESVMNETIAYLSSLEVDGVNILRHNRKTFALGFIVCCKSVQDISRKLFNNPACPIKYLLTYKFSQDHLELFFSCVRSKGGWNNNPNALQLKWALRRMLYRNSVRVETGNCIDVDVPNVQGNVLEDTGNRERIEKGQQHKTEERDESLLQQFELLQSTSGVNYKQEILGYIAGYIVHSMVQKLVCGHCIKMLLDGENIASELKDHNYCLPPLNGLGFTKSVSRGGLKTPSESVFTIVKATESFFMKNVASGLLMNSKSQNLADLAMLSVTKLFMSTSALPFQGTHPPNNEIYHEDLHETQIIKGIVKKYMNVRLYSFCKDVTNRDILHNSSSIRSKLTKLITFKNV